MGTLKHYITFAAVLAATIGCGCNSPTNPDERVPGPAAVIAVDSVVSAPGGHADVALRITYPPGGRNQLDTIGRLDFTVVFDPAVLPGVNVTRGEAISEWAYLIVDTTTDYWHRGSSWSAIRITTTRNLADDGSNTPGQGFPEGPIANFSFLVKATREFIGTTIPLTFHSNICYDNTMSPENAPGTYYSPNPRFGSGSEEAYFDTMGCKKGVTVIPVLAFERGAVTVAEPPPIRGDVSLDGEVTVLDLTGFVDLFENHTSNLDSSLIPRIISNADCNGDGISLTIADLDYLARALLGGLDTSLVIQPPYSASVHLGLSRDGEDWLIEAASASSLSGVLVKIVEPFRVPLEVEWDRKQWSIKTSYQVGDTLVLYCLSDAFDPDIPIIEDGPLGLRLTSRDPSHPAIVAASATMAPGVLMEVILDQ